MSEVMLKTHLIVSDVYEEYSVKWFGNISKTKPVFENGKPIFVVVAAGGRMEINTTDSKRVENCAKLLTRPKGRQAVTSDTARIYIKEEHDKEALIGTVTHNHVKEYRQMYDKFEYI